MGILKLGKESLISMTVLTETIPIIIAKGWLPVSCLAMTSRITIQMGHMTCRVVRGQKPGTDLISWHLQAPSTPCLVLPPPPGPRQRRPGSMQINHQIITLNHQRNLYQVNGILTTPSLLSIAILFSVNPLTGDILGLPGAKSPGPPRRQSNHLKVNEYTPILI